MKFSHLCGAALVLLLAGCGDKPSGGGNVVDNEAVATGAAANAMLANALAPPDPNDPARLQALIAKAMPMVMSDSRDALYRNLRGGAAGAACGEVASKPIGRAAPVFRPFVINPDGIAVVAETPKLAFDDPNDFVADAWIRWCASPEELQKLAPQLHHAATDPGAMANVDAGAEPPVPDTPPPPPPARPAPAVKPPPASVESFFNSVQHSGH
ncbi:MAG TPA: hypothetical protein VH331_06200 [Allosphingosinicella sp.]|jgi:hypothetical protein|nr:hypothetical protein [Allosphingosinicella sp.]